MNPFSELDRYSPEQIDRLHDAAKQRANQLRHEALDDFWNGLADGWSAQQSRASRAAARLASAWTRHTKLRSGAAQDHSPAGCR